MSTMADYVQIPPYATLLHSNTPRSSLSLPHPDADKHSHGPGHASSTSNVTSFNILPSLLLSSTLHAPTSPSISSAVATNPSANHHGPPSLLSTRDPLAIPTISANFKRFISKCGPYFWVQDRLEEVVMWRKGWKVTSGWMAAYTFLCYYPRLIFLLPHITLITILLSTQSSLSPSSQKAHSDPHPTITTTQEGSPIWQANLQGIQNLMGAYSDLIDALQPFLPYFTHRTPYTPIILITTIVTFLLCLPVLPFLPMRIIALTAGLLPFLLTHPFTRANVIPYYIKLSRHPSLRARFRRVIDNSNLDDRHWRAEMREVELWENERWSAVDGGAWGKVYLRTGERSAWTRGRDGWSGIKEDGSGEVSNLTFALPPGWSFVETEDWRADIEGIWALPGTNSDEDGWIYTNDAWLNAQFAPMETWKATGMTRRRRWVRRIYYSSPGFTLPAASSSS